MGSTFSILEADRSSVATQCMFWNNRGWTLAYKITNEASSSTNPGNDLRSTAASNTGALATSPKDSQAGKLSDTWIRANCDGQYMVQQYNGAATKAPIFPMYCSFDDSSTFSDGTRTAKKCSGSTTYSSSTERLQPLLTGVVTSNLVVTR